MSMLEIAALSIWAAMGLGFWLIEMRRRADVTLLDIVMIPICMSAGGILMAFHVLSELVIWRRR